MRVGRPCRANKDRQYSLSFPTVLILPRGRCASGRPRNQKVTHSPRYEAASSLLFAEAVPSAVTSRNACRRERRGVAEDKPKALDLSRCRPIIVPENAYLSSHEPMWGENP